ncbi:MAG TPA: hypothetical protein VFS22_04080, partial [Flavisolibacter sp.]|nr:hypothetical protein [Flavisolibacter sp.]
MVRTPVHYMGSVLLLLLVLLPFVSIIFLQLWQLHVKHEAKEKLEQAFLETIVLQRDQFYWEEEGKEISIGGRMFDVKSFLIKEGCFIITGIFDDKETAIHTMLSKQAGKAGLLIKLLAFTHFFFSLVVVFSIASVTKPILRHAQFHLNRFGNNFRKIL